MQDETQKEVVKVFTDRLTKIKNEIRALMQRQQQAMAKAQQNGDNAEVMAKLQAQQAITQQKLQSKQMADQMKLQQKEMAQRQKMMHRQQEFASKQQIQQMESLSGVRNEAMMAAAKAQIAADTSLNLRTDPQPLISAALVCTAKRTMRGVYREGWCGTSFWSTETTPHRP